MQIIRYDREMRQAWDAAVDAARNGTFLFHRSYMDYHSDRFEDFSLLMADRHGRIVALLPASRSGEDEVVSHGGLTYGGLIATPDATLARVGEMYGEACSYYARLGFARLVVKPVPHIYAAAPCEEELYWLNRLGGKLTARSASQTIDLENAEMHFSTLRRRKVRRARACGWRMEEGWAQLSCFWPILTEVLRLRHGVAPVHTMAEMQRLAMDNAPHIRLYTAWRDEVCLAGTVVYECGHVAHAQYISGSKEGRETGALDALFDELTAAYRKRGFRYFDFGISTEQGGSVLNEGLTFQKEGFGARTICYDAYTLNLSSAGCQEA